MNETLVNTKTSLEPLVLTSLSKLSPRLLTMNKMDESEFQPFAFSLLIACQSLAFIENSLYRGHCADQEPPNPFKGKLFEGILMGFLRPSCHIC